MYLCTHWQSSHQTYEDDVALRPFTCSLLYGCDNPSSSSADYPMVTNSGTRLCQPEPFKRRPCSACPSQRKFCHGRCPYNNSPGAKCLFGTCSASPYRENAGATCSQMAMDTEENECSGQCEDISNNADTCQTCIVDNIDPSCQDVSGAACWYCGGSVLAMWRQCFSSDLSSVAMIDCISRAIVPSCSTCVCTLLCYWSPTDDLCTSCLDQPQLASLFLHHQHCPQGWVYSEASETCYKSYNELKPWSRALIFCENGGGRLAQPTSSASIHTVLESINIISTAGMYWLGAKQMNMGNGVGGWQVGENIWIGDFSKVDNGNWAPGYPLSGLVNFTSYNIIQYIFNVILFLLLGSTITAPVNTSPTSRESIIWSPNYPDSYEYGNYAQVKKNITLSITCRVMMYDMCRSGHYSLQTVSL